MTYGRKTGGRRRGTPNRLTADLRAMVFEALHELGGIEYLKQQAIENPPAFMALLGKLVPKDVKLGEQPAVIQVITGIPAGDPPTCTHDHTPAALSSRSQQID